MGIVFFSFVEKEAGLGLGLGLELRLGLGGGASAPSVRRPIRYVEKKKTQSTTIVVGHYRRTLMMMLKIEKERKRERVREIKENQQRQRNANKEKRPMNERYVETPKKRNKCNRWKLIRTQKKTNKPNTVVIKANAMASSGSFFFCLFFC